MSTLYDLLGALPDDSAEGLRTAFRKAVKGAHPDINAGDPDAALKFREIVRANEILSDEEQRSAYDHLLDLARLEQESASKHALAARIHKFASATMAVASVMVVAIGGYLLFMHISAASVALPRRLSEIAAVSSADFQITNGVANGQNASAAKPAGASASLEANARAAAMPLAKLGAAPAADVGPPPSGVASPSTAPENPDILADRSSDPDGAIPNPVQAIRFDPQFSSAFDPSIIFYRPLSLSQGFGDAVKTKPPERVSCTGPVQTIAKKSRMETRATPVPPPRTAERDPSREGGFLFAFRR
jgi:curved DNA-binding protein CbpA